MILSGSISDWSVGLSSPVTAMFYLGPTGLNDMLSATHMCEAIAVPASGKLLSLGFDTLIPLPVVPAAVVPISSNVATAGTADSNLALALFCGAMFCPTAAQMVIEFDMKFDTVQRITRIGPKAHDRFSATAGWQCTYTVNGVTYTAPKVTSADSEPYRRALVDVNAESDTIRVKLVIDKSNTPLVLRDLLPECEAVNTELSDIGIVLDPVTGSVMVVPVVVSESLVASMEVS